MTETWWHSVPSNLWSVSSSVWEKKNAWSQVKCPLKEMWRWRSLLAPFNLPTMISHEEKTEFSWKTEGQPLSGDKTVHSPLLYFSVVLARTSATGSHLDWVYLQDNLPGGMGGGRGAVWNETRNIITIFFSSPMPASWNLDTFETNYKMAASDSEGSISTIVWKLGVCERSKGW